MWEPVGPLPASVYRRRRWVALAVAAALLGGGAWGAGALLRQADLRADLAADVAVGAVVRAVGQSVPVPPPGPAGSAVTLTTGSAADPTRTRTSTPTTTPTTTPTAPPIAAPTVADPGITAPQQAAPSPAPLAAVPAAPGVAPGAEQSIRPSAPPTVPPGTATAIERIQPDATPRSSVPVPPPVGSPPSGPVPCPNAVLAVTAEVGAVGHVIGERPLFRLVVVNTGPVACRRDLDAARQEIVVWSGDGDDRLWSSNDCVNAPSDDVRTLLPGRPVAFSVRWAGRTTTPGCATRRTEVPAGAYRLMTRLDDVISAPVPFLRSRPR